MFPGTPTPFLSFRPGGLVIPEPDCRQAGGNPGSFHAAPGEKDDAPAKENAVVSEGVPDARLPGGSRAPG